MRLPALLQKSVRRKTIAVVLATALAALLVNALALLAYELLTYRDVKLREARSQAEILGRAAASAIAFNDRKEASAGLAALNARDDFLAAALYGPDGAPFASHARNAAALKLLPPRAEMPYQAAGPDLVRVAHDIVEGGQRLGSVHLVTHSGLEERFAAYMTILVMVMAVALAAALAVSAWLQRVLTAPILDIDAAARRVVEQRDFSVRARKSTHDEIGVLAEAFNRMLDEVERQQAELRSADRRKDEFLATLAHELRNPLAPIRNALYLMKAAPENREALGMARAMMDRQVTQMVRLIDDLIDVSRITTGKLALRREPCDVVEVARSAVEAVLPAAEARGHRLNVELPQRPVTMNVDATRLAQVLINLLNNAVKFTNPGGRIDLRVALEGGFLVAQVRDNGIGVPPRLLESIFEMFNQADRSLERTAGGLGVGLALSRRLVELHGGTIAARSEGENAGAEFEVRIPAGDAQVQGNDAAARQASAAPAPRRILVVDDNVDAAQSLAALLRAMGHEVIVEHDGFAGLQAAQRARPHIAFLDVGMPRMNGFELARRLRAEPATAGTLLVAVTGFSQPADREQGRQAGFDTYLVKPVEFESLEKIASRAA